MSNFQEELPECPLCMEAFEVDDLSFFPCTCGYQICRFCWHRIRTNESGLCPACRKPYPEDPAQFKPLTDDEVHNIKKDRRQKESQRKQKSAENRKHLANVRVVQKNLVFVVGLSQKLADSEVLKRNEYFGKFGKIHKVVINQSTSYVGSQGPSASAYVTYLRPEDALHAILLVNNLQIDNRTLKASLGTTKYCSHFLKGTQCAKSDCMYLHDLGDDAASFSKEDIQQGKHLQYEQKLIEQYSQTSSETSKLLNGKSKSPSPTVSEQQPSSSSLHQLSTSPDLSNVSMKSNPNNAETLQTSANFGSSNRQLDKIECEKLLHEKIDCDDTFNNNSNEPMRNEDLSPEKGVYTENDETTGEDLNDSDALDDDFGFDPWDISSKGLADMMEKERMVLQKLNLSTQMSGNLKSPMHNHNHHNSQAYNPFHSQQTTLQQAANLPSWAHSPKPFSSFIEYNTRQNSKLLQMMSSRTSNAGEQLFSNNPRVGDGYNAQGWQDDLKALLPNINISFSPPSGPNSNQQIRRTHPLINSSPLHHMQNGFHSFNNPMVYQETGSSDWYGSSGANTFNSAQSITSDPAIISTGVITDGNSLPRWMESFSDAEDSMCHVQHQHIHRHHNSYHHLGYGMHASPEQQASWMQQHSRYPPPGFSTRQHNEATTEHRLSAL